MGVIDDHANAGALNYSPVGQYVTEEGTGKPRHCRLRSPQRQNYGDVEIALCLLHLISYSPTAVWM